MKNLSHCSFLEKKLLPLAAGKYYRKKAKEECLCLGETNLKDP